MFEQTNRWINISAEKMFGSRFPSQCKRFADSIVITDTWPINQFSNTHIQIFKAQVLYIDCPAVIRWQVVGVDV